MGSRTSKVQHSQFVDEVYDDREFAIPIWNEGEKDKLDDHGFHTTMYDLIKNSSYRSHTYTIPELLNLFTNCYKYHISRSKRFDVVDVMDSACERLLDKLDDRSNLKDSDYNELGRISVQLNLYKNRYNNIELSQNSVDIARVNSKLLMISDIKIKLLEGVLNTQTFL